MIDTPKAIEGRAYSPEQLAYIDELRRSIRFNPVKMAVVDYLGKTYQADDGSFKEVDETTPNSERFGVRDSRHVSIYKLDVIMWNRIEACDGHGFNS